MISIIIPTYNEELTIAATIKHVQNLQHTCEIIVADGGSQDQTVRIVSQFPGVALITSPKGRASQMNTGAKYASGQTLLFLHADTRLPVNALQKINQTMQDTQAKAGGFLHKFSGNDWRLRWISIIDNYRCRHSKVFYGDQALFICSTLFWQLDGFPDQPILEDWAFGQKLRRATSPVIIDEPVITDSRKFEQAGIWRSFMHVTVILTRLKLGLPVSRQHPFFSDIR